MKKEKKKLEVDNAFANWDGCIGCLACYMSCAIYIALAGTVLVAGGE
jgi:L-lactate utilization protein LutB